MEQNAQVQVSHTRHEECVQRMCSSCIEALAFHEEEQRLNRELFTEVLEALERLLEEHSLLGAEHPKRVAAGRAAIKKARGE